MDFTSLDVCLPTLGMSWSPKRTRWVGEGDELNSQSVKREHDHAKKQVSAHSKLDNVANCHSEDSTSLVSVAEISTVDKKERKFPWRRWANPPMWAWLSFFQRHLDTPYNDSSEEAYLQPRGRSHHQPEPPSCSGLWQKTSLKLTNNYPAAALLFGRFIVNNSI